VLSSGAPVTGALAQAVRDAQLDGSPVPVHPARLLVATLANPGCDAVLLLLAAHMPPWRVLAGLCVQERQQWIRMSRHGVDLGPAAPGPEAVVARSLRRLSLAQSGLVGVPGLTVLCGLVELGALTGLSWITLVVTVPALIGFGHALGRVRAGWWSRAITVLAACLFLIAGFGLVADRTPAGHVIGLLVPFGLVFLFAVGWCVRSGPPRRRSAVMCGCPSPGDHGCPVRGEGCAAWSCPTGYPQASR
jgi:hypothetical protein